MCEGFLLKEVPNDTWTLVIENHSIRNSCPCFMNDLNNMVQPHRFSIAGLFFFRGETFSGMAQGGHLKAPLVGTCLCAIATAASRQHFVSVLTKLGLRRKRV